MIFDTSALIEVERGRLQVDDLFRDDDDVAMAAVTAAELLTGVALADEAHAERRSLIVEGLLTTLPIEVYDLEVARAHAVLLADTYRAGHQRGSHDLIIAATAVARDRIVVTADPGGFEGLSSVRVRG